jgi:hypothetical protein
VGEFYFLEGDARVDKVGGDAEGHVSGDVERENFRCMTIQRQGYRL